MEVVELGISGSKSNEISRVSKMLQILSSSLLKIPPNQTDPFAGNFEAGSKNGKTSDVKSEKSRKFRFFFVSLLCEMFNLCLDKLS